MTVMFHDIHKDDQLSMKRHRVKGTEFDEVLYADVTICISQHEDAINRLLAKIETEGARDCLKLNRTNCEYLKFGDAGAIGFSDGTLIPPSADVKYLGCNLKRQGGRRA